MLWIHDKVRHGIDVVASRSGVELGGSLDEVDDPLGPVADIDAMNPQLDLLRAQKFVEVGGVSLYLVTSKLDIGGFGASAGFIAFHVDLEGRVGEQFVANEVGNIAENKDARQLYFYLRSFDGIVVDKRQRALRGTLS